MSRELRQFIESPLIEHRPSSSRLCLHGKDLLHNTRLLHYRAPVGPDCKASLNCSPTLVTASYADRKTSICNIFNTGDDKGWVIEVGQDGEASHTVEKSQPHRHRAQRLQVWAGPCKSAILYSYHPARSAIKQMLTSAQKLHPKAGKYLLGAARARAVVASMP